MKEYKTRRILRESFMGESTEFVATNDRIRERVENISHEKHVIEEIIQRSRHDDVFWDVGACLGIHSFVTSNFLPHGEVVAFEPMPSNRGVLVDNKSINNASNITVSRKALSDTSEEREFAIRESAQAGFGRHSFSTGEYDAIKTIPVNTEKGDRIKQPQPNIVKIDVEGAGPLVVEGMKNILSSDECHTIIFETHEPNPVQPSHEDFGYTETEFIKLVEKCGFEVENLETEYHFVGYKNTEHTRSVESDIVDIVNADIANANTEAIINSAGTTLRMGSGVAGSLREAGGEKLNESAILKGPVEAGDAVRTKAYDLNAEFVYHAASMPHYDNGESTPETIEESLKEAFKLAEEDEVTSVAVPLIGCGLGGVPSTTGSRVIRDTIDNFDFKSISEVKVVTYKDEEHAITKRMFEQ